MGSVYTGVGGGGGSMGCSGIKIARVDTTKDHGQERSDGTDMQLARTSKQSIVQYFSKGYTPTHSYNIQHHLLQYCIAVTQVHTYTSLLYCNTQRHWRDVIYAIMHKLNLLLNVQ